MRQLILIIPSIILAVGCCAPHTSPLSTMESAAVIEKAIRDSIGKETGNLTEEDLSRVSTLWIMNAGITDLKPLAKLTELKSIDLPGNRVADLTPLTGLVKLEHLDLSWGNNIKDLTPLIGLTNLRGLVLSIRGGGECRPFPQNPNLTWAEVYKLRTELSKCEIVRVGDPVGKWAIESAIWYELRVKLSPEMGKIEQLQQKRRQLMLEKSYESYEEWDSFRKKEYWELNRRLFTAQREIEDSYINSRFDKLSKSELEKVTYLDLPWKYINDLKPLEGLTNLESLNLYDNNITDVSPLVGLKKLKFLSLSGNDLTKGQIDELQKALPKCEIR